MEKGDDGGARRRYISSFSASGINRRWLDAWSLEGAASKIYRSIKMIARPAAASETAFRGFISRRCIKHAYSRQVAGERNWTTIPGDLFTRLAARSITFHRQPEMNGLFARCFHDFPPSMAKGVVIVELSINLEKRFHPNGYKNSSVYLTILQFLLNEFKFKIPNL